MIKELWEKSIAFHGHACPGLAIGVRAAAEAIRIMDIQFSEDEDVVCITENDACGVDAVQAILGCTMGKGNLIYHGTGKMAFSFYDRKNNKKIRFVLKNFDDFMNREWADRQTFVLEAPFEDVFKQTEPTFTLPERARIFCTETCAICGEGIPENKTRIQEGQKVCLDCYKEYDRGW
jgi:formylmethanofuran dehydrogenase subunit E